MCTKCECELLNKLARVHLRQKLPEFENKLKWLQTQVIEA